MAPEQARGRKELAAAGMASVPGGNGPGVADGGWDDLPDLPIFDALPVPAVLVSEGGWVMVVNRSGRENLGLRRGQTFHDLLPDLWRESLKTLHDGKPRYALATFAGRTHFIARMSRIEPWGASRALLYVFEDSAQLEQVTTRMLSFKRLSRELDAIIDSSYDGLWICDEQGRVIRVNPASERLNNLKAEDIVGRNMKDLVAEGLIDRSVTLEVLATGRVVNLLQHTREGRKLMLTGNPVFDDDGRLILVVVNERDITEIDALHQSLEQEKALKDQYRHQLLEMQLAKVRFHQIIARSPVMVNLLEQSIKVSSTDSTVLILGETGVGKGMVADLIHKFSRRCKQPMIRVNCGAIPESLIESELFGYVGGAFTGARKNGKPGHFELADGGTLFLDEVSELPLPAQVKLLRFLDDGCITRVGGTVARQVDVRIIAATNRDLAGMVERGEFRKDLYYRLNVIPLRVPCLRERRECIFPLLQHYLERFCARTGKPTLRLTREAADLLVGYEYPGNVRELINLCERLAVLCENNPIEVDDLPRGIGGDEPAAAGRDAVLDGTGSLRELLERAERRILARMLEQCGSQWELARRLQVNQSTISRKLKKHGLDRGKREPGGAAMQ